MLSNDMPISLLAVGDTDPIIDKVVTVCCSLINLCPPIVPMDKQQFAGGPYKNHCVKACTHTANEGKRTAPNEFVGIMCTYQRMVRILLIKSQKNPIRVAYTTTLPASVSKQAPHKIDPTLARTTGRAKELTMMPIVMKIAASMQELVAVEGSLHLLAIRVGIGDST
nr:unnamed protein product [Callosobruchus analis]